MIGKENKRTKPFELRNKKRENKNLIKRKNLKEDRKREKENQ